MNIRTANPNDAERLLEIYAYYVENTAISFEYEVPSPDEFRRRMEEVLKRYPYLVLEEDGEIRGYSYAAPFNNRAAYDHSCEVTIYLAHDKRGLGYGTKLYEELEQKLKEQGIINLYACISDPVEEDEYLTGASESFHRHAGFVRVGEFHKCGYKFGRWYNMIWMEKIIGEHLTNEQMNDAGSLKPAARKIQHEGEKKMDFDAFDTKKLEEYAAKAKAEWGETAAYREFEQKSKGRSKEKDAALAAGMMSIFAEMGAVKNTDPASEEAQGLVRKLQGFITENYYTCTNDILSGLGRAYAAGGEFTQNIDKAGGEGTAQFAASAIEAYCRKA